MTEYTDDNAAPHIAPNDETKPGWATLAWIAIRPHTLPLSISPVLAGGVVGWVQGGTARPDIVVTAALSAMLIQIATNLHNDAIDTLNGTDRADRLGPVRISQRGWVKPGNVLRASYVCYALAALIGSWLVVLGGWPVLAIGVLSIAAAWSYSSGPSPISRGPLGELFVLLFFGLIAVGTIAWLHSGTLTPAALLVGLVVGLPATTVLLINNTRDIEGDRRAGRRTLAILLGRERALFLCRLFPFAIIAALAALALLGDPWFGALAGLIGLVIVMPIRHLMAETTPPALFNDSLKRVVRFQLLLTAALCTGIIVTSLIAG